MVRRKAEDANEPWLIFSHGESFHNAAFYLRTYGGTGSEFAFPIFTCYALSEELFLKCLATMHGGTTPPEHGLELLFGRVSPAHQARIRSLYLSYLATEPHELEMLQKMRQHSGGPDPLDFVAVLEAGERVFERMRYGYEKHRPNEPKAYFSGQLLRATRSTILEIHPEWARIQHIKEQLAPPTLPAR